MFSTNYVTYILNPHKKKKKIPKTKNKTKNKKQKQNKTKNQKTKKKKKSETKNPATNDYRTQRIFSFRFISSFENNFFMRPNKLRRI